MEDDMECRQQPRCDELLELREKTGILRDALIKALESNTAFMREIDRLMNQNAKLKACLKRAYYILEVEDIWKDNIECPPGTEYLKCGSMLLGCTTCIKEYIAHGGE